MPHHRLPLDCFLLKAEQALVLLKGRMRVNRRRGPARSPCGGGASA